MMHRDLTIIFDLDGTLTDTLADLMLSTNYALRAHGYPERTIDDVRRFVGNGVHRLIERAVPDGIGVDAIEATFKTFTDHYVIHCQDNTCLYAGVADMLRVLKSKGYAMAIVSNKLQAGVDALYDQYFRDTVSVAVGQRQGVDLKPSPDMIDLAMSELGKRRDAQGRWADTVYIGDSEVDLLTASNSSLPCISVLWGFRDKELLLSHGATTFASTPSDVIDILASGSL